MAVFSIQEPIGCEIHQKTLEDVKREILGGQLYVAVAPHKGFKCSLNVIFFKSPVNGDIITSISITLNKVSKTSDGITLDDAYKNRVLYKLGDIAEIGDIKVDY
jgi:hypothetical protein